MFLKYRNHWRTHPTAAAARVKQKIFYRSRFVIDILQTFCVSFEAEIKQTRWTQFFMFEQLCSLCSNLSLEIEFFDWLLMGFLFSMEFLSFWRRILWFWQRIPQFLAKIPRPPSINK